MNFLKNFFKKYKVLILLLLLFIIFIVINSDKIEGFVNKPQIKLRRATISIQPGESIKIGSELIATLSDSEFSTNQELTYNITEEDFDSIINLHGPLPGTIATPDLGAIFIRANTLYQGTEDATGVVDPAYTILSNEDTQLPPGVESSEITDDTGVFSIFISEDIIHNNGDEIILDVISQFDGNYTTKSIMKWYVDANFDNIIRVVPDNNKIKDYSGYGYRIVDGVAVECEPGKYMPKNKILLTDRTDPVDVGNDWGECVDSEPLSNDVPLAYDSSVVDSKNAFCILDIISHTLNLIPQKDTTANHFDIDSSLIQDNKMIHSFLEGETRDFQTHDGGAGQYGQNTWNDFPELKMKIVEDNTPEGPVRSTSTRLGPDATRRTTLNDDTRYLHYGYELSKDEVHEYILDSYDDWILNNLTYTKGFLNRPITKNGNNYTDSGKDFITLPDSFRKYYYENASNDDQDSILGVEEATEALAALRSDANATVAQLQEAEQARADAFKELSKSILEGGVSEPSGDNTNQPGGLYELVSGYSHCDDEGFTGDPQDCRPPEEGITFVEGNWDKERLSGWSASRDKQLNDESTHPGLMKDGPAFDPLATGLDVVVDNSQTTLYTPRTGSKVSGRLYRPDLDLTDHNKSIEILKNVFRNKRHPRYEGSRYENNVNGSQTHPTTDKAEAENKDHNKNTIVLLGNIEGIPSSDGGEQSSEDSIFEGNSYMIDKFTNLMYLKGNKFGHPSIRDNEKIKTHNVSDYEKINGTNINVKTYNYLMTSLYAFARPPVTLGSKYQNLTDLTFGGWGTPPSIENGISHDTAWRDARAGLVRTQAFHTSVEDSWDESKSRSNVRLLIPSDILGWHMNETIEAKYNASEGHDDGAGDSIVDDIIYNMVGLRHVSGPGTSLTSQDEIDNELWKAPTVGFSVRGARPDRHGESAQIDDSKPLFHIDNLKNMNHARIPNAGAVLGSRGEAQYSLSNYRDSLPGPDGSISDDFGEPGRRNSLITGHRAVVQGGVPRYNFEHVPELQPNYYLLGNDIGVISSYYELGTHITFRENPKVFKLLTTDWQQQGDENFIKEDGSSYKLIPYNVNGIRVKNDPQQPPLPVKQFFLENHNGEDGIPGAALKNMINEADRSQLERTFDSNKNLFRDVFMKSHANRMERDLVDTADGTVGGDDARILPDTIDEHVVVNEFGRIRTGPNKKWDPDGRELANFINVYDVSYLEGDFDGSTFTDSWVPYEDSGFQLNRPVNFINIVNNGVFSSSFSSANTFQQRLFIDKFYGDRGSDAESTDDTQMNMGYPELYPNKWQGGSNVPVITKKKREWYNAPEFDSTNRDLPLLDNDYVGRDINPFFYDLPSHLKYEKIEDLEWKNTYINKLFPDAGIDAFKKLFYSSDLNTQISSHSIWDEDETYSFSGGILSANLKEIGIGRRDEEIPVSLIIKKSERATKLRQIIGSKDLELDRKNKILIGSCRNVFNPSFHSPFGITNPRPITNDYIRTIKPLIDGVPRETSFTLSEIPILRNYQQNGSEIKYTINSGPVVEVMDKQSIPARVSELEVVTTLEKNDDTGSFNVPTPDSEWKDKYDNFRRAAEYSINQTLDSKIINGSISEDERSELFETISREIPVYPPEDATGTSESIQRWIERFPHDINTNIETGGSLDPDTKHTIILSIWDRFTGFLQMNTYPNNEYGTTSSGSKEEAYATAEDDLDINQTLQKDDISAEGKMFHLATSNFGSGSQKKEELRTTNALNSIQEPVSIGDTLPRIARLPTEKTFGFGRPDTTIFNSNYNDNHRCLLDSIDQINYSPTWSTGKTAYLILTNFLYNYIYINERNIPVFDERSIQPITLKTPNTGTATDNEGINDISSWGGDGSTWDQRLLVDNDLFRFSHQPAEYWNSQEEHDADWQLGNSINDYFYRKENISSTENIASEIFRPVVMPMGDGQEWVQADASSMNGMYGSTYISGIEKLTKNKGIYEVINFFKSLNKLYTSSDPMPGLSVLPISVGGLSSNLEDVENFIYEKYLEKIFRKIFLYLNQSTEEETPIPTPGLNSDINGSDKNDGLYTTTFKPLEDEYFRKNDEDYPLHSIISKTLTLQNKHISKFAEDSWKEIMAEGFDYTDFPLSQEQTDGTGSIHRLIDRNEIIEGYGFDEVGDTGKFSIKGSFNIGYGINNTDTWSDVNGLGRPRNVWRRISLKELESADGSTEYTPSNVQTINGLLNSTVGDNLANQGEIIKPNLNKTILNVSDIYRKWDVDISNTDTADTNLHERAVITSQGIGGEAWLPEKDRFYNYIEIAEGSNDSGNTDSGIIDPFDVNISITTPPSSIGGSPGDFIGKLNKHISNIDRINWYKMYNTMRNREPRFSQDGGRTTPGDVDLLRHVGMHPLRQLTDPPTSPPQRLDPMTRKDWKDIWLNSPILDNNLKSSLLWEDEAMLNMGAVSGWGGSREDENDFFGWWLSGISDAYEGAGVVGVENSARSLSTYDSATTTWTPGFKEFLFRLNKSVLHNAKYNPYISELVGITNTYNGRPAFHDFVLKAGINSWGGMVDGVGGIKPHYVDVETTGGGTKGPDFDPYTEFYERPVRISTSNNNGGVDLRGDGSDAYTASSQAIGGSTGLPFEHIFRTEPFKVDGVIYHRLVLPMPPQIQASADDPYGIGVGFTPGTTTSLTSISETRPRQASENQRHYYNVMFWKNIYDIIHPKNQRGNGKWFDLGCEYQAGCAEHDMEAQCIQINEDGSRFTGGSGLNPANNKYYYQCVRPYLWDPENNIGDFQWNEGD